MADKPKRGLSSEQWLEVRKAYEAGESVSALSKRFKIRRPTIDGRIRREGWTVQPTVQVHGTAKAIQQRAQSKVIDIATGKAIDSLVESGAISGVAEAVAEELIATSTAGRLAAQAMVAMLTKLKDGLIKPASEPGEQNEAQVYKDAMSAYRTFQTTVRENHALAKTQPSIPRDDSSSKVGKVRFVVVRPQTGTDG